MSRNVALITVNPTLDIFFEEENFSFSEKIFTKHSCIAAGGTAVNVARGLQRLKRSFKLYIIIGGEIGELVKRQLIKERIPFCFSENKEETRLAAIWMGGSKKKMFVTPTPKIKFAAIRKFICEHYSEIANHDLVLIGGSVPEESSECIISDLLRPLINQRVKVIVDSRGLFAQRAYIEVPYVIRYNWNLQDAQKVKQCLQLACDLHRKGTSLVIYNTNKYSYSIYDSHIWRYPNFTQFTKRIYGRGDAFLAGLISRLLDEYSFGEAVRFAIACGASFTRDFPLGEISRELIPKYLLKIQYDVKQRIM